MKHLFNNIIIFLVLNAFYYYLQKIDFKTLNYTY
jgi:hypothetical protein